ncbi:outer membrane efflux protein domain-containing protein [Ditylenchus destructor]|uniref:Outer membrane efflux protein domain-containing protein n=1 Tax=Ditylenchus destructor TaxID=166010 RepID=A0AAD4MEN4_9BILA|nr:outer membrane efflux protein domain-containing protein [Ditylenchus destructor]
MRHVNHGFRNSLSCLAQLLGYATATRYKRANRTSVLHDYNSCAIRAGVMMTVTAELPGSETARAAMWRASCAPAASATRAWSWRWRRSSAQKFLPESQRALAYRDRSVPLGNGRAQSPPLATGPVLTEARLRPEDKVLIVGAAGGYAAAVAGKADGERCCGRIRSGACCCRAHGMEGQAELVEGPLADGCAAHAPYDPFPRRVSFAGIGAAGLALPAAAQTAPPAAQAPAATPNETLREAMVKAYNTNPTLFAERATLRASDEDVPIARSRGLPGLSSTGRYSENLHDSDSSGLSSPRQGSAGLSLSVPVFSGGAVRNSVRAGGNPGRGGPGWASQCRDPALHRCRRRLSRRDPRRGDGPAQPAECPRARGQSQATRDRFEVGDLTRTDVAQSEARLAGAQSQLRGAEAGLISSRENYIRVVGTPPGILAPPPPLPNLQSSPDQPVGVRGAGPPGTGAPVGGDGAVTSAERGVIAQTRSAYAVWQSAMRVIESSRLAVPGQPAQPRGCSRREQRRHAHDPRYPQRRAGTAQLAGPARHCRARRLCRRLCGAGGDGPCRGAGSGGSTAAALRPGRQLQPLAPQHLGLA